MCGFKNFAVIISLYFLSCRFLALKLRCLQTRIKKLSQRILNSKHQKFQKVYSSCKLICVMWFAIKLLIFSVFFWNLLYKDIFIKKVDNPYEKFRTTVNKPLSITKIVLLLIVKRSPFRNQYTYIFSCVRLEPLENNIYREFPFLRSIRI